MDCAACQILDRYAQTGLFMQPVECVFCKNIIDNETESDREQENAHQPENHQEIVSQNLPPEMEVLMNEDYSDRDDDDRLPSLEVLPRIGKKSDLKFHVLPVLQYVTYNLIL